MSVSVQMRLLCCLLEEDHSPCPQDQGDEEFLAGPDAASMEGATSKFMEGLEGQERSGVPQIHRLLSCLPVPVQKKSRSMTHAEAHSRIPEADLPELHNKAVALLDQASHLTVPTLLLWTAMKRFTVD